MKIKKLISYIIYIALLSAMSYGNTCKKWIPIPMDGLVVVVPFYPYNIQEEGLDCDDVIARFDKIVAYAQTNGASTAPSLQDYHTIGVNGVDSQTAVNALNKIIAKHPSTNVDSREKIQHLWDQSSVADTQKPIITLRGAATITITQGSTYTDQGATATDNIDGDITARIITIGEVNTDNTGTYALTYRVSDKAGNSADDVTRVVVVAPDNGGDSIIKAATGANVSNKTFDLFKRARNMDLNNIPYNVAFSDYGQQVKDDGKSSKEHLITGTKYYFSSSTGNDRNDGKSPAKAKKTLRAAKILSSKLKAGDGIMFKRGDTWSAETENFGSLNYLIQGTEANPIVFTCYGTGALPVFDARKEQLPIINAGKGWNDNGDGTWYTEDFSDATRAIPCVWINGERKPAVKTLDELAGATWGNWAWTKKVTGENPRPERLWINFNPNTLTSLKIGVGAVMQLKTGSEYVDFSYMEIKNARSTCISAGVGRNITISNCVLGENAYRGVTAGANSLIFENIVDSKEPAYGAEYMSKYTHIQGGFEGITVYLNKNGEDYSRVYNNTVKNFRHANLTFNGSETVSDVTTGNAKMYRNLSYMDTNVMDYGGRTSIQFDVSGAEVYENITIGGIVSQLSGKTNKIYDNLFYKATNSKSIKKPYNTGTAIKGNTNSPTFGFQDNEIRDNVFYKCDGSFTMLNRTNEGVMKNNSYTGNISYECGQEFPLYSSNYQQKGTQLVVIGKGDLYTYGTEDAIVNDNILYWGGTEKPIARTVSTEAQLNNAESYYTVDEFKTLVNGGIPEVAEFSNNKNFDIATLIRD